MDENGERLASILFGVYVSKWVLSTTPNTRSTCHCYVFYIVCDLNDMVLDGTLELLYTAIYSQPIS